MIRLRNTVPQIWIRNDYDLSKIVEYNSHGRLSFLFFSVFAGRVSVGEEWLDDLMESGSGCREGLRVPLETSPKQGGAGVRGCGIRGPGTGGRAGIGPAAAIRSLCDFREVP